MISVSFETAGKELILKYTPFMDINSIKQRITDGEDYNIKHTFSVNQSAIRVSNDDFEEARNVFSTLCQKYPKKSWAYWGCGVFNIYMTNNYSNALHCFSEALHLDPANVNFMAAYSRALYCIGKHHECIDFLKHKLDIYKDCQTLEVELISALIYSNQLMEAKKYFYILDKINNLSPLKYQLSARIEAAQGNFDNAIIDIKRAIVLNQKNDDPFALVYNDLLDNIRIKYQHNQLYDENLEQARRLFYIFEKQMLSIKCNSN